MRREFDVGRSIRTATNSHDSSSLFPFCCSDPPNHHTFNDVGVDIGVDFDKILLLIVDDDLRVVKEGFVNPNENKDSGLERSISSSSIGSDDTCSDFVFDIIITGVGEVLGRRRRRCR